MSEDDDKEFDAFQRRAMTNPFKPSEYAAAVKAMRAAIPEMIELTTLMAKFRKAKFDALVAAGFTDAQALELCKEMTP